MIQTVLEHVGDDKGRILFEAPYVPAEWIAAHGFVPHLFRPSRKSPELPIPDLSGTCAYMRHLINDGTQLDAVGRIMTTQCDQMRRSHDFLNNNEKEKTFLMHVPATWQSPQAYGYYIDELRRLGDYLIKQGGNRPSDDALASLMIRFEALRADIMNYPWQLRGNRLTDALNGVNQFAVLGEASSKQTYGDGSQTTKSPYSPFSKGKTKYFPFSTEKPEYSPFDKGGRGDFENTFPTPSTGNRGKIPIAVIGSALCREDDFIFELIEQHNGRVVFDGTLNGETLFPSRFNRRQLGTDPLETLTNAYFFGISTISRRPNAPFFAWLKQQIEECGARGVLLARQPWCDHWHAEVHRIKPFLKVPVIDVAITGEQGMQQCKTRIHALLEMVA